jgi:hypothetical protein
MNREGYKDPTAEQAIQNVARRETRYLPKELNKLIAETRSRFNELGYELMTVRTTDINSEARYRWDRWD